MWNYLTGFDDDLLDQFERMRRQLEGLAGSPFGPAGIRSVAAGTFPAINVGASPEEVDLYVFAAGIDPKRLDITLQQNLLTIAGERNVEFPDDAQIYRNERHSGGFRRVLSLPEDVDPEKVNATYRDGVLQITVKRREAVRPRQIEVK